MSCRPRVLLLTLLMTAGLAACQPPPEATPTAEPIETVTAEEESLEDIPPTNEIFGGMECLVVEMDPVITVGDKRLNFTCSESGGTGTALVGDFQVTDAAWAIEKVDYITDGTTYTAQASKLALITRIILEDESDCGFSGPIIDGDIAGSRLAFVCDQIDDLTSALFGTPTLGEYGWEILKADYRVVDDQFEYWNAVKGLIVSVVIAPE